MPLGSTVPASLVGGSSERTDQRDTAEVAEDAVEMRRSADPGGREGRAMQGGGAEGGPMLDARRDKLPALDACRERPPLNEVRFESAGDSGVLMPDAVLERFALEFANAAGRGREPDAAPSDD